jgi:penicillin-binding protein 1A
MTGGTGTGARTTDSRPQAGKTGTTDDYADAWFCGYTPDLAVCVWMGYPDGTRPMLNVEGVGAVSGPTLPSDIWHLFMDVALQDVPPRSFPVPRDPVDWGAFTSLFESRIVSDVSTPEITLVMPTAPAKTATQPAAEEPAPPTEEAPPPPETAAPPPETAPPADTTAVVP